MKINRFDLQAQTPQGFSVTIPVQLEEGEKITESVDQLTSLLLEHDWRPEIVITPATNGQGFSGSPSGGHTNGLLLAGLALHRLDRSEEAAEHFAVALERMTDAEADELSDVGFLLDEQDLAWYRSMTPGAKRTLATGCRAAESDSRSPMNADAKRTATTRPKRNDGPGWSRRRRQLRSKKNASAVGGSMTMTRLKNTSTG